MNQWYALYTKPRQELRVAALLEEKDIHTFVPLIREIRRDTQRVLVPYFPCYLFAAIDMATADSRWHWTPGLRRLVSFDGQPVVVPASVVGLLRRHLDDLNVARVHAKHPFKAGDRVRIKSGPFADLEGLFERDASPDERVAILLEVLGRTCRVELDLCDLAKAPDRPPQKRPRRTRGRGHRIKRQPEASPTWR